MAGQAIRIETNAGRRLTANEIFEITRRRENALSRLLVTYIATGLGFMLLRSLSGPAFWKKPKGYGVGRVMH